MVKGDKLKDLLSCTLNKCQVKTKASLTFVVQYIYLLCPFPTHVCAHVYKHISRSILNNTSESF